MSDDTERNVSRYTVLVDGQEVSEELNRQVREVMVRSYLRLPDVCTIVASFPRGEPGQPQPIDDHPFRIGAAVEIRLGARDELTQKTLFKGQVVSLELTFGSGGVEMLVRGFDRAHVFIRSRRVRTFQNQTSSDIVEKIVGEAGLQAQTDSSGDPHEFIQQDNETDWDFIWRLAERIGFEFVVEDTVAHFRRQNPADPVALEWPSTLRSFSPRVTATQQVKEVTLSAQDPKAAQSIDVSVSTPNQIARIGVERDEIAGAFPDGKVHIATEPVKSQSEGQALAQALLDKLANGYIAAEGVCDGNPDIKAGVAVDVSGVGHLYSGTYRVAAVTHVLRGGATYETHFANSPAHTLSGQVGVDRSGGPRFGSQLVIGIVTNNSDSDGMGRVRVRYPALGPDNEGAWARIASVSAGSSRGMMMMPQVGEEVLIGFEHEDTTRPYVLGSLFNGNQTPGSDLLQSQDGSFSVVSDHKVRFASADDTVFQVGKGLTINVANGTKLTDQKDIAIESEQGDITLETKVGSVNITGQQNIQIKANMQLTLTCGPSSIQLGPSGVTVSGPMINLGG